jgi:hypothetical protein
MMGSLAKPTRMHRMRVGAARSWRPRLEPWFTPATTYPLTRPRESNLATIGTGHYMTRLWHMAEIA